MKKFTFFFAAMVFIASSASSQDYLIHFTGSGLSNSVETVLIVNLTRGDSLLINGADILHLTSTLGIQPFSGVSRDLTIYPNPISHSGKIEFYNSPSGQVIIEVTDLEGKSMISKEMCLSQGRHIFEVSELKAGSYVVRVTTDDNIYAARLVSSAKESSIPKLIHENTTEDGTPEGKLKSIEETIQMLYYEGERLLLKGSSGNYARVITLTPTQTETIDFEFIECMDADGKHYAVVTIGEQTWMAENLAYLPLVSPSSQGSSYDPFYYVWGYQGTNIDEAKATKNYQNYGVLYNWPASLIVCPDGWHLPTHTEWSVLTWYLGGENIAGGKLKSIRKDPDPHPRWEDPNYGATNENGFSALPGGHMNNAYNQLGEKGSWWTSTTGGSAPPWIRGMFYDSEFVFSNNAANLLGLSVRCLRD
ncbi:MAG: T9SS type A sorting domain-containing protein [Bacteroidales bacterium]|nr:T9SS type A sorting domain-containing protein [Bacteroidales bacterium]